ncbi:DNA protecting protein DprA [Niastella yeongjuensis]|uniref:DNA protecting protein DprA n=1 Tax=Niastella yeongjuensis TaxID=354355 RepID=A0A1V9FCD3_9BACT|nr:DNA-processing protein DprA [Niastella yeongjuensis]OQP55951.1 DNA protecting protein DprA [Niastella yeongjuensis]SEP26311.1 DNA processing protein [Niastella yeongjuensis]
MINDLLYQLALTQVPQIGCVHAKLLIEQFHTAEAIFKAGISQLEKTEGIGTVRAQHIKQFRDFAKLEKEIDFIEKYKIKPLFISQPDYPQRLLHCYDSPTMLFYRGNANLNTSRIVAVIGTRMNSAYGKHLTENLVEALARYNVLVISGLAFGIDAIAHKAALQHATPTVGVLAHGLDSLYPTEHTNLAKEMVQQGGGLITEFFSDVTAEKHHFPIRNRVVAGMCDAVVVVETGVKGGSMITAELANGYNRDVFAYPGRVADAKSAGCNALIKNNKAILLTNAQELAESLGWNEPTHKNPPPQKELFVNLNADEQTLVGILSEKKPVHIDELNLRCGLSTSSLVTAVLNLQMQNIVQALPGNMYQLV